MRFEGDAHFLREAIDREVVAQVFDSGKLGLDPSTIESPGFRRRKYGASAVQILLKSSFPGSAGVRGPYPHDRARFFETGFIWESSEYPPSMDVLNHLAGVPGFIMAVGGDYFDVFWQSAAPIDYYETFNRPHQHLPTG